MSVLWAALSRWFTGSWLTAIVGGIALTGISVIGIDLISSLKSAGAAPVEIAKAKIECDAARTASNNTALEELADKNRRAVQAANAERDKAKLDADQRLFKIHDLEVQLAKAPGQPQCGYSPEVTGSLRK